MNDITSILLKIVVGLVLVLATKYIIPYLKTKRDDVRWNKLIDMVQVAVEAAEQQIKDKGSVKKEEVTKFVSNWLNTYDINVTPEEIDKLIEAAVYKMNNPAGNITISTYVNGEEVEEDG